MAAVKGEKPGHFAGHPHKAWIGRMVKSQKKGRIGKAGNPARILGFRPNGKVILQPRNHAKPDVVDPDTVHPWWSQNPDLKPKD